SSRSARGSAGQVNSAKSVAVVYSAVTRGPTGAHQRSELGPQPRCDRPTRNDRHVVRLTRLMIEQVLAGEYERQSAEEITRTRGPEMRDTVVLVPVGAQSSTNQVVRPVSRRREILRQRQSVIV